MPEIPGPVDECGHCREDRLQFERAIALGSYEGLLGELIVRMKYDRNERLASTLATLILSELGEVIRELQVDGIVPVPMVPWRRLARGTNSPAALAALVGRELGVPVFPRVLQYRRKPSQQKGLSRSGRFRNMRNLIFAKAGYPLEASHVLLVDDILTTGATCSEAARALKQAGAAQASVLVAGRTPSS
ncbi:MAG: ComF family protein [Planctomycetales bacterium]|nr:ComF family protein [Planctomycetales bacterium]